MTKKITIAIDGFSSTGKSTLAKQLAKHQRQKCINLLEKITKNLFRMFRNTDIPQDVLVDRFFVLYNKLAEFKTAHLYAIYHIEMKNYIEDIFGMLFERMHHFAGFGIPDFNG